MKVQTRLYAAFGAVFLLVAAFSTLTLINLNGIQSTFQNFNEIQLRLSSLANDIRYYDSTLTDAVRAYLIDPEDQAAYDRYYRDATALDQALIEAQALATTEEDRQIFENINAVNADLVTIEESLLAEPDIEQAVALYRGTYGQLKARYAANVQAFFDRQQAALDAARAQIIAQVGQSLLVSVTLVGAVLAISAIIAVTMSRSILNPLRGLIRTTEQIARGGLEVPLPVPTGDELGELTQSFGIMVSRMRETLNTVENRTRDLQTVADVNAQITTILNVDRLLQDVVDLTKERFRLYHAHLYTLDDTGETLVLTAGAGHVGRRMVAEVRTIALDNPQSIVAAAARNRKGVLVNDVTQSPTFLPHPLLPDTRSELAAPLVARGQLLGVLDAQSDEVDFFSQEALGVMELMAGQIATALSNARLYEEAERTSRHERALGTIDRRIQEAVDVDEILRVTVRELGKALRVPHTAIELRIVPEPEKPPVTVSQKLEAPHV